MRAKRDDARETAELAVAVASGNPAPPAPAGQSRRTYLGEVSKLLWPPPATVVLGGGAPELAIGNGAATVAAGSQVSEFILLPGAGEPRLVVPSAPRPAGAAVRRYGEPASRATWLATRVLGVALASGLGGAVFRDRLRVRVPQGADTIESYLAAALAREVKISLHLGAARANRKPVLQLLSPRGAPVGYAKVGVNPLTRTLVRAERDALDRLHRAGLVSLTVPRVLHYGRWRGLDVLVLSALPVWLRRRRLIAARLAAAMREVAAVGGLATGPLACSAYWERLRARLATADESAEHATLSRALDAVAARAGDLPITYGAWHGDWTPWNMASTGQGLLVWDWERFAEGAPLGFDALHYWLAAESAPGRRAPATAAASCAADAAQLLAPFGVGGVQAPLTAILYLSDLATRYLVDRQAQAGARRGSPGTWLIPAITSHVSHL